MISGTSATTAQLHGVKPHSECSLVDKSLILRVNSGAQKQLHNRPSLGEGATPRAPRRGAGHRATPRGRFPRPSKGDEKMGAPYVEWAMANRARLLLLPPGGGEAQIGGRRRSKFNLPPGGGMALMKSVAWSHNPRRSPNGETHLAPSRNRHPSPALPGAPDARRSAAQQGQSGPAHYPAPGSSSLLHPAPAPSTQPTDTPTPHRPDRVSRATTAKICGSGLAPCQSTDIGCRLRGGATATRTRYGQSIRPRLEPPPPLSATASRRPAPTGCAEAVASV